MISRSYSIIEPLFDSKRAKLKSFTLNILSIILLLVLGILLTLKVHIFFSPLIFLPVISPYFLERFIVKKYYTFKVVGDLNCYQDRVIINISGEREVVKIQDVKGINIRMLIRNPKVKSHALDNKHNAYSVIVKCGLERQFSFSVFNYQNDKKIANDYYDITFLGELKHYSKMHPIRFWNWKGDPYVDL